MDATDDDVVGRLAPHVDLGHAKRSAAFLRQVALACSAPGQPPPAAAGKVGGVQALADVLSLYRFVGNESVSLDRLREARAGAVLGSLPHGRDLLVLHDVSLLDYSRHESKTDRRPIGDHNGRGYEYVACAAADPQTGSLLGVLHDTVVSAAGPDDQEAMDYDGEKLFAGFTTEEARRLRENHRHQMAVHVTGMAQRLKPWHAIHVADREFDDLFVLGNCRRAGSDLVIRCNANRNVQMPHLPWLPPAALTRKQGGHPLADGYTCVNLKRVIKHVPLQPYKTLPVNGKNRVVSPGQAKRRAVLSIGTFPVRLYRPAQRNGRAFLPAAPVDVNIVVIRECHPPTGVTPLCWVLYTTLPVDTPENLAYVGWCYELRWSIENLFRLLKSGYRILSSRLDNATKIGRYLVILTIAAMAILQLKTQLGLPATGPPTPEQYDQIRQAAAEPDNPDIPLNLRLFAFVATRGGWLARRRDPIGPTILMRGILHLLAVLDTIDHCGPLIFEALENPQIVRQLFCV